MHEMIMICVAGLDHLQSSGEFPCAVCRTRVGSNSIFWNSCKHRVHNTEVSSALVKDPDYSCTQRQGTAHGLDSRLQREASRTYRAGGGSFLLLPRRHALSSWRLWTFNHNRCENRLEEVQGAATSSLFPPATSSLFPPSLFQDTWPRVQLLCAECNAPSQWDLATDKAKPPTSAAKWGQWTDRSSMSSPKTLSPPDPMSYLLGIEDLDLILKVRLSWYMWNTPIVQSRQHLSYRLMESFGLRGLRWHGSSWQRGIA